MPSTDENDRRHDVTANEHDEHWTGPSSDSPTSPDSATSPDSGYESSPSDVSPGGGYDDPGPQ
jgi:hypothetical protein